MLPFTPRKSDLERFWSRVDQSAGPDACWAWTAGLHRKGYGRIRWGGEPENTHRIAWTLANGPIPRKMHVLHSCDNRPCCNPAHLFLGTQDDNMKDKMSKGRGNYNWRDGGSIDMPTPPAELPSTMRRQIAELKSEIVRLKARIAELEAKS